MTPRDLIACTCELDHVCEPCRVEQEMFWLGHAECRECGTPFRHADPPASGLCVECSAGQEPDERPPTPTESAARS